MAEHNHTVTGKQRAAVDAVRAALRDAGANPYYHGIVRERTEHDWPTLGRALRALEDAFPASPSGRVALGASERGRET